MRCSERHSSELRSARERMLFGIVLAQKRDFDTPQGESYTANYRHEISSGEIAMSQMELGAVGSLWRYPVKSMMGEELNAAEVTDRGLRGDGVYALVDRADGKVATAKNPRKWPHLFDFRANLIESEAAGSPSLRITLPD